MKIKILSLAILSLLSCNLMAQKKYIISWDYKNLSFREFVLQTESLLPVKFFYKNEWVTDLKLFDYKGCKTLSCVLDSLFKGKSLYYLMDDSGKIVITKIFAVKVLESPSVNQNNYIPLILFEKNPALRSF